MTIAELNAVDLPAFVSAIGWVFEHSPWVAERAWKRRPFRDVGMLHTAMVEEVQAASTDEQLALLLSHPDLGARARLTAASSKEQAGAGLDSLTPEEFERLRTMNAAYRAQFGFPFLYAVRGGTKYDILQALERRIGNAAEQERQEALRQVYRIAEFRLRDTVQ